MRRPTDRSYLASLEAESHRPEVQQLIREAIRKGTIRVVPVAGYPDRVKIVRVRQEDTPARTLPMPL